jgi:hypothetical protein
VTVTRAVTFDSVTDSKSASQCALDISHIRHSTSSDTVAHGGHEGAVTSSLAGGTDDLMSQWCAKVAAEISVSENYSSTKFETSY